MNDVRVFEATLQQCVERHRRAFLIGEVAMGLVSLGAAWHGVGFMVDVLKWSLRCFAGFHSASGSDRAAVDEPLGVDDAVLARRAFAVVCWLIGAAVLHCLRVLLQATHPDAYVSGFNSVLQNHFGWRYDAALERLQRGASATSAGPVGHHTHRPA